MRETYVLYFYSAAAFRQVVLPAINNADYTVRLSAEQFQFREDVTLLLEAIENIWYFHWESEKHLLGNGDFLKLKLPGGEVLSLIVWIEQSAFWVSKKYELPEERPVTIGSAQNNVISYNVFQLISATHAMLLRTPGGCVAADKSKNGVYINGNRMKGQQVLRFGDCIDLFGLRIVFLEKVIAVYYHVDSQLSGIRLRSAIVESIPPNEPTGIESPFHRSPRKWRELDSDCIEIEPPAARSEPDRQPLLLTLGPAFTMVLPLLVSVGVSREAGGQNAYLYPGLWMAGTTALLGVFWGLFHWLYRKKGGKWEEKRRRVVYKNYLKDVEEYIAEKYRNCREILLERYQEFFPAMTWLDIKERLWNRNPGQSDFLCQRIGLGEALSSLEIRIPRLSVTMFRDDLRKEPERLKHEYERLKDIPVCVDLAQARIIGLAGGPAKKGATRLAINILLQIAINNCYTDVKVALLYNEDNTEMNDLVSVMKWLPHTWAENRRMRYLAGNRTEAGEVLYALNKISNSPPGRHYVLFVEEDYGGYMFAREASLYLTTIFIAETMETLPNECNFFLQNDACFSGIRNNIEEKAVIFDEVPLACARNFAREIAGIRVAENRTGGELTDYIPFLSLFPEEQPEAMDIAGKWRKSRINESIRVPIGRTAGNRILYLDVHERYHGPHGLIAGTTGSGKSETLQTYLLSLAIHFSPEDVSFFIIDYKGGGMGNLFGDLPHTVGIVSNLSGNQIRRALISIKSENKKRQQQFLNYGMNHINQYTTAYKNHKLNLPMPHLFIVVDEFAELKREEPEFMKELVSVAQVGRSLGVHLILATQKPAGVVDDNIRSNARFRLCLRVQDRQDSMDMLHKADAADLTGVGRGFLQVGNNEVFELFQAAYSGATYVEKREKEERMARMISRTGQDLAAKPEQRLSASRGTTQLEKMVVYLKELCSEIRCEAGNKMWLPPLPEKMALEEMNTEKPETEGLSGPSLYTCVGLCDDPGEQNQFPLTLDICRQGNILICGSPATGKSTLLQTLLYTLMYRYAPQEVEFYLIDLSSHMLGAFVEMPHVAGSAGEEAGKWERIFYRLKQELRRRKELFAGGSYIHTKQQVPAIVLVIDNYAGFRVQTADKYEPVILQLAAEGKNNGIYLILTASGIGMGEVPGKLAGNFGYRLVLELGDLYQYGEILRVSRSEVYPEAGKRGRGIVKAEDRVLEFQTALVMGEENDFIRMEKIKEKSAEIRKRYFPYRAEAIPEIPEIPHFDSFYKQVIGRGEEGKADRIPIGYEQVSGGIYEILLKEVYCYLISGRKSSGKTNLLKVLFRMIHRIKEKEVIYIDFSGKSKNGPAGARSIGTDQQLYQWLEELAPVMQERNQDIHQDGKKDFWPIFVLIDNMGELCRHIYHPQEEVKAMGAFVEHLWEKGSGHGLYWFAAWNPEAESGVLSNPGGQTFMGYGKGLHLGGNTAMQRNFIFNDLSYSEQNKPLKPGLALIPSGESGRTVRVIIPLIEEGEENDSC